MGAPVYLALLHYPIVNRNREIVTTAVTNMDLHDISRSCRTFGIRRYFVVTPVADQHTLLGRILAHWSSDAAREYHPARVEAISRIRLLKDFNEVKAAIREETGDDPEVVLTDARPLPNTVSYGDYRRELADPSRKKPAVIVFGTGWGISDSFYPEVDRILAPICGPEGGQEKGGYNHLSVRSAVAIILDRLFGQ